MITDQEVEKTLKRVNELSEEVFIEDYKKVIMDQEELFKFAVQSSEQFQLDKDSENAMTELLFNIFSIYKDKYEKNYTTVKEKTIMAVLNSRNEADAKQAEILGIDIENDSVNEDAEKVFAEVNDAVRAKTTDTLTGKAKEFFEYAQEQNNRLKQKNLTDYITYYIGNDELIKEKDRAMVNMITDTVVESLEKHMGR